MKSTAIDKTYFLEEESLSTYLPNEVFSIDFSQIKTSRGPMWMHGASDIITGKMCFLEFVDNQSSETVFHHFKKLPPTTKIINTDHGSSYLADNVQKYLLQRNIKHSLGRVACSYDNRWIEDFWKRIKYEWFTQYPIDTLSYLSIEQLLRKYFEFFNNTRISYRFQWNSPNKYELFLLES